jgi:predicted nuclease of predicted toxin-antitoxin system
VRFLVDRCAGRRLAEWLRAQGHDVVESRDLGADPGDRVLLQRAALERRVLITMDRDFGALLFGEGASHAGRVRLPDVPSATRWSCWSPRSMGWSRSPTSEACPWRVPPPALAQPGAIRVASLLDLAATQFKVVQDRAELKDYQDLAAILRTGLALDTGASRGL